MTTCGRCQKDKCNYNCEISKYFENTSDDKLIYNSSGFNETPIGETLRDIEQLAIDLPDVDYILDNIVYYMFTNNLISNTHEDTHKIDEYMNSLNFDGQRNIDVLKGVAKGYRKYGYYGLLNTGHGLIGVHPEQILACVVSYDKIPVIRQNLTYIIRSAPRSNINDSYGGSNYAVANNGTLTSELILEILANPGKYKEDYLVVTDTQFACVRLDTSKVFGISPLLKDRKRVKLILNILDRMNYDIVRNGIGTIALKAKVNLMDEIEETAEQGVIPSSGQIIDVGRTAKAERQLKIAEDMKSIADKLSTTENNDAFVYSSRFEDLQQLERDTKAVDFLDFLCQYVSPIISQMFGVPARLFDLGKTVSNIGTHSIIDNAMRNCIIPMRDHFIGQCNPVLMGAIGISTPVEFSSYEFTKDYNYENDLKILEVYNILQSIDPIKAENYLNKNLIV